MNILYFLPRYDAGAIANGIHTEILEAWRAQGVQSEILTLDSTLSQISSAEEGGIMVHRLPVNTGGAKVFNRVVRRLLPYPYIFGALTYYRRFLAKRRYDLIHIETAFPLGAVATLQRVPGLSLAITLPGADVMSVPEFDYGYGRFKSVQALLPRVFNAARSLRACSPQLKTLALKLGAPQHIAAIPYNVTAYNYLHPDTDMERLRARARAEVVARHGLDKTRPIVLTLSRLHPFKGVAYLIEALPEIHNAGLRPQAVIAGPSRKTPQFGDYGEFLKRRATELGVQNEVALIGSVDHSLTPQYLAAADIVVIPSVAESFNRVAIEAGAVGTPVVVTRTTGVSDYVAQAESGVVVEERSSHSISEAIRLLLTNKDLSERYGANGRELAEQFRSPVIAAQLLELYRSRQSVV